MKEKFNSMPDEDPDRFEVQTGNYFIKFRLHPEIFTLYINCYTNLGEEYKETKLDEVVSKYTAQEFLTNYLYKEVMIMGESKSYIFEYSYSGEDEDIKDFYRKLIPDCKEETRNDVTYIQDSVVGTEIAQYIRINPKLKTINVDEVTYQE